jgi:hypothetical protein
MRPDPPLPGHVHCQGGRLAGRHARGQGVGDLAARAHVREHHAVGHALEAHGFGDGLQALRAGARVEVQRHLAPDGARDRGEGAVVGRAQVRSRQDEARVGLARRAVVVAQQVVLQLRAQGQQVIDPRNGWVKRCVRLAAQGGAPCAG